MRNQNVFKVAVVILAAGCAYSAPYKTSGPSFSEQGVQVGLAGIRCYVNRGADAFTETLDDDQVGLDLKLQIHNGSDRVAEVSEGQIRLAESDVPSAKAAQPERSKVIALLPGETRQVPLSFAPDGVADCHHNFELEFADSVETSGGAVVLSPIDFRAKL
jgi:hypothetical protein